MAEGNKLFREKSVEAIESPEKLDQYLKVTRPGGWVLLAAVLILLAGMIVWGCFAHITTKISIPVYYDKTQQETVALIPVKAMETVVNDRKIELNGQTYEVDVSVDDPIQLTADKIAYFGDQGLSEGDIVYQVTVKDIEKFDWISTGSVETENVSPISFLINPGSGS